MGTPPRAYVMADVILSAIKDSNQERHQQSRMFIDCCKQGSVIANISDLVIMELNCMIEDSQLESLKTILLDMNPCILPITQEAYDLANKYTEGMSQIEDNQSFEPENDFESELDELLDRLNHFKYKISIRHSMMTFEEIRNDLKAELDELDSRLGGTLSLLMGNPPKNIFA